MFAEQLGGSMASRAAKAVESSILFLVFLHLAL
jgi:hypothetical protein